MHVAVLGAGVIGVTTAHFLAAAGHDVTIVDRAAGVALGCSRTNGAQLSYSYTDAMASPSFLLRLPALMAGADNAIRIRPPVNADLLRWGLAFLAQCTRARAAANTRANLELSIRSAQLLRELRNDLAADFHYREAGKLILLRTARQLDDARRASDLKAELGVRARVVSMSEAERIEPAVAAMTGPYAGAVYSPGDDVGDAREFTALLADRLVQDGARLLLDTAVTGLIQEEHSVIGVRTAAGDVEADGVVVCLGADSAGLLRDYGVRINLYPARGYSVTLPPGRHMPSVSVTDFGRRFVVSRLGEKIRIAGFADFVGFSARWDGERIGRLLTVARETAPDIAGFAHPATHGWAGNRPMTPDGRPLIGATPLRGLYLNTGHGTLGWTLACGSAERLVETLTPDAQSYRKREAAAAATAADATSSIAT